MPNFIWHDLTITVSEMSRAAALDCARDFNAVRNLFQDDNSLLAELEVLCALHTPCIVKDAAGVVQSSKQIVSGDTTFELTLPLTRENFDRLPFSLTRDLIIASVDANEWLLQDLKKVFSRIEPNPAVSPSGSAPSTEQTTVEPQPTMTTGTESTRKD